MKPMERFFLRYGRSRSKARSLHETRQLVRKLRHGRRWSHEAWQIITKNTNQQNQGKTQIPQPDLRLTVRKTAKQTAKGARAQQEKPQEICQGHSGRNPLCHIKGQKHAQTNYNTENCETCDCVVARKTTNSRVYYTL